MTDQTATKYTLEDLWKFPCDKQSLFFFMTLLYIAFQLNSVPHPKEDRCCLYWVILNVMDFRWIYYNQNWFKLSYKLSQTCKWNISAHSGHVHRCWVSRKTSFQSLLVLWSVYATKKYPVLAFLLADISSYCLDWDSHGNLVLIFNTCLFYMYFRQENALQSNMVLVRFSPKRFPRHAVVWRYHYEHALPSWARAFIFTREPQKNLTYIRNANSLVYRRLVCIWASHKMILYTGFTWYIRCYLETILVASRNNRFDAQISQTDKALFCLGACCLSAKNGKHAALKSVKKNRRPKILNLKKNY